MHPESRSGVFVGRSIPSSSGSDRDACSAEAVGDGRRIESELRGDLGERGTVRVAASGGGEFLVVPLLRDGASLNASAIEVGHDSGAADTKAFDELRDRGAGLVVVDECIDLNTAKSALRSVLRGGWGSRAIAC